MKPSYLGDSYDIVKKFFCRVLKEQGYDVFIDPMMFTGKWDDTKKQRFYLFLGVKHVSDHKCGQTSTALLVDPDTGVWERGKNKQKTHVSFDMIADLCKCHRIVFVFDQSFALNRPRGPRMKAKLKALAGKGCKPLYYKSHACFLFASRSPESIWLLRDYLVGLGLPEDRLVM
jgi:hypothetical protein